jgi:hypothetical protein
VNGQQIINNWTNHASTENSGTISLTAGQRYDIRMEYFENGGLAVAKLSWSSASTPKSIIPSSQLYSQPAPQFVARVNFQPAAAPVPSGYLWDDGAAFAARGNGFSHGWNIDNRGNVRDRNSSRSPDQRYDTLIHMQRPSSLNAVWEIALPNGTYRVRVVTGDPSYYDSVYRINVEGVLSVNGNPNSSTRWLEATVTVTVSDGRLTVSNAAGSSNNKLCFVEISSQ